MVIKKITFVILLNFCLGLSCQAQFRLPPLDIEVKGGISGFPSSPDFDYLGVGYRLGLHFQINQNVALGWSYMRSSGDASDTGNGASSSDAFKTSELATGPSLRLSTGRSKKMRPYLTISYSKVEVVSDMDGYRFAAKSNAPGLAIGLLLKLGNKMYINLFDVTYRQMSDEIFWLDSGGQLEIKAGILYNLGKKK